MNTDSKKEQNEQCTIPIFRRSFWDEFKHSLDKVERNWLRRGALLIITLVAIPLGAIAGVIELVSDLYKDCW